MLSPRLTEQLDRHLQRAAARRARRGLPAPQVLVTSGDGERDRYASGDRDIPFHAASIGKLVTTALAAQLVDRGRLAFDAPVAGLLPDAELRGLFADETAASPTTATIAQLLAHTSGVADYFDGVVRRAVVTDPDRTWTPAELLDVTRTEQRPLAAPGRRFAYSDTGFVLLGRVLEELTGDSLERLTHARIFEPLGMRDSWYPQLSRPASADEPTEGAGRPRLAPFWLDGVEVSTFRSISCGWAGGGIATTLTDLVKLSRGLHGTGTDAAALVSPESLAFMQGTAETQKKFRAGIRYGSGMMQLRFEGFSPFLRGLPRPTGHIGVLSTHLWYDPVHDVHMAMNFHSTREMVASFQTLIRLEQALERMGRG